MSIVLLLVGMDNKRLLLDDLKTKEFKGLTGGGI